MVQRRANIGTALLLLLLLLWMASIPGTCSHMKLGGQHNRHNEAL